ncbi:type I-E CRISPR-associated protein Cse2/CasB [Oscillatoria sp. CS-180]|nr:type I-E CRISPR-associated protein Cse2/CasB [Oscillatoria sp. CS-180]
MTITTPISPAVQRAAEVLHEIHNAIERDSGVKATLKRTLTGEPRHQRAAYPIILRYLSDQRAQYQLEQWLWVTGFLAYYPQDINPKSKLTFGDSARQLKTEDGSKGPERRFRSLLETSLEDLRSPLTAMVRLMRSSKKKVVISYPQLLVDLNRWEHPDQYIQDKWARAFWNAPTPPDNAPATDSSDLVDA